MAQVGEINKMMALPNEEAEKASDVHIPLLGWMLGLVLAALVCTLGCMVWLSQELLASNPELASHALFGSIRILSTQSLFGPLLGTAVVWSVLALVGIRTLRAWGTGILSAGRQSQASLQSQLDETESRLSRAHGATEFWKGKALKAEEKVRNAEVSRRELEGKMGQLAVQERRLAKEQEELSRSKDRLEKHVEARTLALHQLQQRYMSILDCAGEGICSFDLEERITFANPASAEMMGWAREELLGMKAEVFADHSKPIDRRALQGDSETSSHPSPIVFQRKDSTLFPVEMVRTPVQENGRQVGTVLIFKDVTERTEADERFSAKVAELARSNSELEQFAFVASHDLQEPLRKIQAFGDRLKGRLGEGTPSEALDYLNRMQSAAARMQGLIDGLLMYSRVLTRAQPFSQVDLNTVVREVLEDLEVRIEKSRAVVRVDKLPIVAADALQIRQLLQNLIGNALKFQTPGNPPLVKISARWLRNGPAQGEGFGHTEFFSRVEMCELTVEDNGIGFDESYLKRLFVVFQRLHSRNEFEGTGIGLAVCRKIVNRHGGWITARSQPGKGSRFIVLLPAREAARTGGVA